MKVITVQEPYAALIGLHLKKHLTLDYGYPYKGFLLLYANRALRRLEVDAMIAASPPGSLGSDHSYLYQQGTASLVIACRVVRSVPIDARLIAQQSLLERAAGRWYEGQWAWQLDHCFTLPQPVKTTGRNGLWDVPTPIEADVIKQLPPDLRLLALADR